MIRERTIVFPIYGHHHPQARDSTACEHLSPRGSSGVRNLLMIPRLLLTTGKDALPGPRTEGGSSIHPHEQFATYRAIHEHGIQTGGSHKAAVRRQRAAHSLTRQYPGRINRAPGNEQPRIPKSRTYRWRAGDSRFSALSNRRATAGVLKSPVRISRLVALRPYSSRLVS